MFRQRTKKGSDMSRMDKKEKKQMEMEQQAREEALEEELEAELPVQEAQPQESATCRPHPGGTGRRQGPGRGIPHPGPARAG